MKLSAFSTVLVLAFFLASCSRTPGSRSSIPAAEAKKHIGENAVVSGTVIEVFVSKQNTNVYLYLDGGLPNAKFAAVWPGTNDPPIKELEDLMAKPIEVKGKIIADHNVPEANHDVPEIVVNFWDQIDYQ